MYSDLDSDSCTSLGRLALSPTVSLAQHRGSWYRDKILPWAEAEEQWLVSLSYFASERSKYILIYPPKSSAEPLIKGITFFPRRPSLLLVTTEFSSCRDMVARGRQRQKKKVAREQSKIGVAFNSALEFIMRQLECSVNTRRHTMSLPFFFGTNFVPARLFIPPNSVSLFLSF